jgi:hypothetical protein
LHSSGREAQKFGLMAVILGVTGKSTLEQKLKMIGQDHINIFKHTQILVPSSSHRSDEEGAPTE